MWIPRLRGQRFHLTNNRAESCRIRATDALKAAIIVSTWFHETFWQPNRDIVSAFRQPGFVPHRIKLLLFHRNGAIYRPATGPGRQKVSLR
jgi:hypothetical protein